MIMTISMNPPKPPAKSGRDRWIPWVFVAGFLVVLAVNGTMIYVAFATWTGVTTTDAYQRGLAHNARLAEAEAQRQLGWDVEYEFVQTGPGRGRVELVLTDRHGTLLDRAAVSARFVRPVAAGHDIEVTLDHLGLGRYAAEVELPLRGQWEIRFLAEDEHGRYRRSERVMLR